MTNQQANVDPSPAIEPDVEQKRRRGRPRKISVSSPEAAKVLMATLVAHFGNEGEALRLARAFAGLTVSFPAPAIVERLVRDDRILSALRREPSAEVVRRLAENFRVDRRIVANGFRIRNGGVGVQAVRATVKTGVVGDGQSDAPVGSDVHASAAPDLSIPPV